MKVSAFTVEEETLMWSEYFCVCFKKVAILLFGRNKPILKILPKNIYRPQNIRIINQSYWHGICWNLYEKEISLIVIVPKQQI